MKPIHEQLLRLNASESLRVAVEPTPSGRRVARFGLWVQRENGPATLTPHFTVELEDVRTVARALARAADFLEHRRDGMDDGRRFIEQRPATVVELANGRLLCQKCGHTWFPAVDGTTRPYRRAYDCPGPGCRGTDGSEG